MNKKRREKEEKIGKGKMETRHIAQKEKKRCHGGIYLNFVR